jgi:ubiquinone/menaquinone biosynthesis C-methylase UbiE
MNYNRYYVRIRELERRLIRFFGGLSNRDFEYDFASRSVVGEKISVLDVGGSESLLPLLYAKRGFSVTVFDFRKYQERHSNITSIQGDFLKNTIADNSFDYVVMISAIEHIGFGSYGAPVFEDGDFQAFGEAKRIVKKTGKIIVTVPFANKDHIVPGYERWYSISRIRRLFKGMHILAEEYYIPAYSIFGRIVKYLPASLEQITKVEDVVQTFGYQCNACYVVSAESQNTMV